MASVFKRGKNWIASFKDKDERWHQKACGRDKSVAQKIANKLETEGMLRINGLVDPNVDRIAAAEKKSLAVHLAEFRADIASRNGNNAYAMQVHQRAERIISFGGIEQLSQLKAAAVNTAIARLREAKYAKAKDSKDKEGKAKYGKTSVSHHLRAIKMFSRWLYCNGHTAGDTLLTIKVPTVAASDKKMHRRALSLAEFYALVTFTVGSGSAYGMTGEDRAMLYTMAGSTGFRQGELRALTPESFTLDADAPAITVKAAYSKRRRDDRQPVPPALADTIKPWLDRKVAGKPVFAMPSRYEVADMLRSDLDAARNQWLKEAEKNQEELKHRQEDSFLSSDEVDFHALRVSYISWLVQSGVNVKTCQELARHSTPVLTIGTYARMSLNDQDNALAALPVPGAHPYTQQQIILETGTGNISSNVHAQNMHKAGVQIPQIEAHRGKRKSTIQASAGYQETTVNTGESPVLSETLLTSRPGGGMADAQDLKSCVAQATCGFESRSGQSIERDA